MRHINAVSKVILCLFWICFAIVFGLFLWEMNFMPKDDPISNGSLKDYNSNWTLEYQDGKTQKVNLPMTAKAKKNEWITISKALPHKLKGYDSIRLRSSQQDMYVYVGKELRYFYGNAKHRFYGSTSPSAYIIIPITDKDAGKLVKIQSESSLKDYENVINPIVLGTQQNILMDIFGKQWVEVVLGSIVFMWGVLFVVAHAMIRFFLKRTIYIGYLGTFAIMISTWVLCESKMRQFYTNHLFAVNTMTFQVLMLCPIPLLTYMDYLQKKRYTKMYQVLKGTSLAFFLLGVVLQINGIDFIRVFPYFAFIILFSVSGVIYSLHKDYKEGHQGEVIYIIVGLAGIGLAGIMEIVRMQVDKATSLGRFICVGVIFFLAMVAYTTFKNIQQDMQEKHEAIEANKAKSTFLAHMSHEIRTPIHAIIGMDEMILRECNDLQILNYANNIKEASKNLLSLINDILDFTKIESGKLELVPVRYDLGSILNDLYNMVQFKVKDKGLHLSIDVNPDIPSSLIGDEVRLRQVILNLLTNAIKYTEKGTIELIVDYDMIDSASILLKIKVKDTGMGIRPDEIGTLFEAFRRADELKNKDIEGSGLGLGICQQILALSESKLMVESEYKKGSVFWFEVKQEVRSWNHLENITTLFHLDESYSSDKYIADFTAPLAEILIVDDNEMNLLVAKGLLKETQVNIETAKNGKECLEKIKRKRYDIIFLDHLMPQMDGIQTLKEFEVNKGKCKDTPVIAMTANAISGAKEKYMDLGFSDYIAKPVDGKKLEKMVKKYLSGALIQVKEESDSRQMLRNIQDNMPTGIFLNPEFDLKTALMYSADGKKGIGDNFQFYLLEEDNTKEKLKIDLSEDTINSYRIVIHSMKNTAKIIGAIEFSDYAMKLEEAANKRNLKLLKENQEDFYNAYCDLCDVIREAKF